MIANMGVAAVSHGAIAEVFKVLLTIDMYVVVSGGSHDVRVVQQCDLAPVDESHFQIEVASDARLRRVTAKVRSWAGIPGAGADVLIDSLVPARRRPALAQQRRQHQR